MTEEEKKERARARALVILQVQAGQKTATEAAAELGVSRQTYHEWEKRGMQGLLGALEDQSAGRPSLPEDPQKKALQQENQALKHKLAVTSEIADLRGALLRSLDEEKSSSLKKRKPNPGNPPKNRTHEKAASDALAKPVSPSGSGLLEPAPLASTSAAGSSDPAKAGSQETGASGVGST